MQRQSAAITAMSHASRPEVCPRITGRLNRRRAVVSVLLVPGLGQGRPGEEAIFDSGVNPKAPSLFALLGVGSSLLAILESASSVK